jgi:hypothetical protein
MRPIGRSVLSRSTDVFPEVVRTASPGRERDGRELDGLGDIAVRGRDSHVEPDGRAGIGVPDAQVSEGEKGLVAGSQPSPAGVDGSAAPP